MDLYRHQQQYHAFKKTELEKKGERFEIKAPVTVAVSLGNCIAVGFGDGSIRFFRPGLANTVTQAHDGVVLCMAADGDHVLTGGDDGRFLKTSSNGVVNQIASFGTKWVDCVAANGEQYACSSGRDAHVWSKGKANAAVLKHISTVGGLAFDARGKRLAVSHYGGVTLWSRTERRWKSTKLIWKGLHGVVSFSPDGKYIVTAMQENALHGWRLRDKANLAMSGYPAKTKSFAWVGSTPYLVTSGANEAVCWPFDSKDGPMNRSPICIANGGEEMVTHVHPMPNKSVVFAGFRDGKVLLAEIDEIKDPCLLKDSTGAEITAIAVTESLSHVLIGDDNGHILWAPLWAEE